MLNFARGNIYFCLKILPPPSTFLAWNIIYLWLHLFKSCQINKNKVLSLKCCFQILLLNNLPLSTLNDTLCCKSIWFQTCIYILNRFRFSYLISVFTSDQIHSNTLERSIIICIQVTCPLIRTQSGTFRERHLLTSHRFTSMWINNPAISCFRL